MEISLKSTDYEFGNQYDFFEIEEVELVDGTIGNTKKKVCTCTKESLVARKEQLETELAGINVKIGLIDNI